MKEQDFLKHHSDALTTKQLQEQFKVLGFSAGFVAVQRKSDGVKGSFNFTHMPRYYYDFKES